MLLSKNIKKVLLILLIAIISSLFLFNNNVVYGATYTTYYEGDLPDKPTKINGVILVNKQNPLPKNYGGENATATKALNNLIAGAKKEGYTVKLFSGYRSYSRQQTLYNNYVKQHGKDKADTFSARAGYSEHQTGLAFDIETGDKVTSSQFDDANANTPAMKWVHKNAQNYGFILRFNSSKTGYSKEFWHFRYIGKSHAKAYVKSGAETLEEYLGVKEGETINKVTTIKDAPSYEVYKKDDSEDTEEESTKTESTKSTTSESSESNYVAFDPYKKQNVAKNANTGVDDELGYLPKEVVYGFKVFSDYLAKGLLYVAILLAVIMMTLLGLQILSIVLINKNGGNTKLEIKVFGKNTPESNYWKVIMLNALICVICIAFVLSNFYVMLQLKMYLGIQEFINIFS